MREPAALRCCSQAAISETRRSRAPMRRVEALAAQHADLDLDHIEPAGVLARPSGLSPMHEALCRSSGTTLDSVHAEDGPPITQRTSG